MELYIERDALGAALARTQGIAEKRGEAALVDHVLLQSVDDGLRLTATDTEIASIGTVSANVRATGAIAVHAAQLFQIVRSLPEPTVRLKLIERARLEVVCGRSKFKVPGREAEDFPTLPPFEARCSVNVTEGALRRVIELVSFAVATDDVRYGLNGAHIESGPGLLRLVGADGHRLNSASCAVEGESLDVPRRMLIPRKALAVLRKSLDTGDGTVGLEIGEGAIRIVREHEALWFRLIDGEFPDYHTIVPTSHNHLVSVRRDELGAALKRASILAVDKARSTKFSFGASELEVEVTNTDKGEVTETVPISLAGDPIQTGFNARYLSDLIAALAGERVTLELSSSLAPCVVRNPDDEGSFFLVMPMRFE